MNRKELLKKLLNVPVPISVDGYGDYKVKGLSTSDYLFAASHVGNESTIQEESYFAAIVARCTLNLKNERVFTDEDVKILSEAEAGFILPLALKIQQLSGNLESEEDVKKG
jgi:hypothetical protein